MRRRVLAERLADARERAGYSTQADFAGAIGLSQQRVSAYERGETVLPVKLVGRYAQMLGIDESELFSLVGDASQEDVAALRQDRSTIGRELTQLRCDLDKVVRILDDQIGHLNGQMSILAEQVGHIAEAVAELCAAPDGEPIKNG